MTQLASLPSTALAFPMLITATDNRALVRFLDFFAHDTGSETQWSRKSTLEPKFAKLAPKDTRFSAISCANVALE